MIENRLQREPTLPMRQVLMEAQFPHVPSDFVWSGGNEFERPWENPFDLINDITDSEIQQRVAFWKDYYEN